MQTIDPTGNNLFCRQVEKETRTASGILLTEKAVEQPSVAEVINLGPGVKAIRSGDKVLYRNYSAVSFSLNKEEFVMIREDDILGKVLDVEEM